MYTKKESNWLAVFAGVCGLLSAFPALADIHIAMAFPLSGAVAALGEEIRSGANIALDDINAKGGVLGQKLVLDYVDDACNATQATSVANKIVSNLPVAVLGHLCSAATLAAAPIYGEAGLPEITISSNAQITENNYRHLFRLMGRDDNQAPELAAYVVKSMKSPTDKVAVLDDKGSWGVGFASAAETTFKSISSRKIDIAVRDSITQGQTDFSSLITRLKESKVTHVVLGLYHMEAGLLVRQARQQGFTGAFFGGDPIQTPEFWKIAGGAAEGVMQTGPFEPSGTDKGKALVAALSKAKQPVGIYTFYAYAALETIADAIRQAGAVKSDAIIKTLSSGKFDTLLGPVSFDAKGDLRNFKYQIFAWHNGEYALANETTKE